MRKLFFVVLLGLSTFQVQAQTQTAPTTLAPASESLTSNSKGNTESFADIAQLGEQIAIAQRKIQAMELKNSLDALEAQQAMGTFTYKVIRVEGFGDTLYAVLSDNSGIIYQVGPGDIIADQYRVSLIRPSSVKVMDIATRKTYAIPFATGGAVELNELANNEISPAVVSSNKTTASLSSTS